MAKEIISKVEEEESASTGRTQARRPPSPYEGFDSENTSVKRRCKPVQADGRRCQRCNGSIPESSSSRSSGAIMLHCSSCIKMEKGSQPSPSEWGDGGSDRLPLNVSQQKGCQKSGQRDVVSHKSLLFDSNVLLPDGTQLYYKANKKVNGYKKGSGIFCLCCQTEVSPTQFEAHAGFKNRRQPYFNIYTLEGVSLHKIYLQFLKGGKLAEENAALAEENDCFICAEREGDDLTHCGKCRKAFHAECVLLSCKPVGTWHCTYCMNRSRCKTKQITNRCTDESPEKPDIGSCEICRSDQFNDSVFCSQTIILCDQCGKEYHVGCLKNKGMADLKEVPKDPWFCDENCSRIYQTLQKIVINGEQELPEPALNQIKKKGSKSSGDPVIRWRLLRGNMASLETRKLFAQAISIFHDAFGFRAEPTSCDLFPDMVYGRTVLYHDFDGMYCALLSVDSMIVSTAILRVFGEVAEIPFVATGIKSKGQGYFTALFSCIEHLLASMKVEDLVVPVANNSAIFWENKLGFEPIREDKLKEYQDKYFTMMKFEETDVLHKLVQQSLKCETTVDG